MPLCVLRVFAFQTALPVLICPIVYGGFENLDRNAAFWAHAAMPMMIKFMTTART